MKAILSRPVNRAMGQRLPKQRVSRPPVAAVGVRHRRVQPSGGKSSLAILRAFVYRTADERGPKVAAKASRAICIETLRRRFRSRFPSAAAGAASPPAPIELAMCNNAFGRSMLRSGSLVANPDAPQFGFEESWAPNFHALTPAAAISYLLKPSFTT